MKPALAAVVMVISLDAFAQRPPAREHAAEALLKPDPTPAGARFLATLPFATRETLRKEGFVVLDTKTKVEGGGMVRAVLRLERPIDEVYALITEPSSQAGYLPHVSLSKTVTRSTEGEATDMAVSFLFTLRYRTQHWFYPEEHRMEWSLDATEAGDLKEQTGFFQLYELDDHTTIAEYGTRVVARSGLIDFLRGLGERGGVADALKATRQHVATARASAKK